LRPSREFDGLADAARGRSRADWLVGMNLTRAYTLRQSGARDVLSVGRVQTPTLAMLVERELAIRDFVSQPYREVRAVFRAIHDNDEEEQQEEGDPDAATYEGVYIRVNPDSSSNPPRSAAPDSNDPNARQNAEHNPEHGEQRLPADGDEAQQIFRRRCSTT
ncbi:MAG: hypothetical protein JRG94_25640, partial [Deltaproteobacteria bacterium]|nr:hypothetical protein [Deltaproteobacteria bacterium]